MVYWSNEAIEDIALIFDGLLNWKTKNNQPLLDYNEVVNYHDELFDIFSKIDTLQFHHKTKYLLHKRYGEFVYTYKRNAKTSWYACYNKIEQDIFITRIISNYKTDSDIE